MREGDEGSRRKEMREAGGRREAWEGRREGGRNQGGSR